MVRGVSARMGEHVAGGQHAQGQAWQPLNFQRRRSPQGSVLQERQAPGLLLPQALGGGTPREPLGSRSPAPVLGAQGSGRHSAGMVGRRGGGGGETVAGGMEAVGMVGRAGRGGGQWLGGTEAVGMAGWGRAGRGDSGWGRGGCGQWWEGQREASPHCLMLSICVGDGRAPVRGHTTQEGGAHPKDQPTLGPESGARHSCIHGANRGFISTE